MNVSDLIAQRKKEAMSPSSPTGLDKLTAAGVEDPTPKKGPNFLQRLFGVISTPSVGIRSLIRNATSNGPDVNPLEMMGKSLAGEDTTAVEGAKIAEDLGVTDKWGQFGAGLLIDIVTDPLTYVTAGAGGAAKAAAQSAITKGAKYGFDAAKMLEAAEMANAAGKADEFANLSKAAKILQASDIPAWAGRSLADASHADQYELVHAVIQGAIKETGAKGGIRFAGIPLGGQGALNKASQVGRETLARVPGANLLSDTVALGPAAAIVEKSARRAGASERAIGRETGIGLSKVLAHFDDDTLQAATRAQEAVLSPDEWAEYGRLKEVVADANERASAASEALNSGVKMTVGKRELLQREAEGLDAQEAKTAIADLLAKPVENRAASIESSLIEQGVDPVVAAKWVKEAQPAVDDTLQTLSGRVRDAGIRQNTLIPEAQSLGAPAGFGYVPHKLAGEDVPAEGMLQAAGLMAAKAPKKEEASAVMQGLLDEANARAGTTLTFDDLAGKRASAKIPDSTTKRQFREEGATLPEFTSKGNLPELNLGKLMADKVRSDTEAIALAAREDALTSLGRRMTPDTDPVTGRFIDPKAAPGMSVAVIERGGFKQFYEVPTVIKRAFDKMDESFTSDEGIKGAAKAYDTAHSFWKKTATRYNIIAYNARNAEWNMWLMHVAGAFDPQSYGLGKKLASGKGLKDTYTFGDWTGTGEDLLATALRYGGKEGQFLKGQTGRESSVAAKGPLKKFDEVAGNVANWVEDSDRLAVFINGLKKGLSPDAAGKRTLWSLYDFSPETRTAFERNIIGRLIPFWGWMKSNTPHMAEMLATRPGQIAVFGHLNDTGQAVAPVDESIEPKYMSDLAMVPLPAKDSAGNQLMWSTNSPVVDLRNFGAAPNVWLQQLTPLIRTPIEVMTNKSWYYDRPVADYKGQLKPVPGAVVQFDKLAAKTPGLSDLWDQVKAELNVKESNGKLSADAYAMYALKDLAPWFNTVSKLVDEQPRTEQDRFAFLSGIKLAAFNTESFQKQSDYEKDRAIADAVRKAKDEGLLPKGRVKKPKAYTDLVKRSKPKKAKVKVVKAKKLKKVTLKNMVKKA